MEDSDPIWSIKLDATVEKLHRIAVDQRLVTARH